VTRQLVLVGLPGAGKSAVGRALADRLGWQFVDLDTEIEREAGRSVAELFAAIGEPGFRQLERTMTERYRVTSETVISTGGGWMAQPGLPALLRPTSRIIHLIVSPEEAVRRMALGRLARPLLAEAVDPVAALQRLAQQRAAAYAMADRGVETDGQTIDEVVATIVDHEAALPGPTI
jgi:shikimate kinase